MLTVEGERDKAKDKGDGPIENGDLRTSPAQFEKLVVKVAVVRRKRRFLVAKAPDDNQNRIYHGNT